MLFYLGLYAVRRYSLPIGWDTPRYLGQTNLAAAHGLAGVPHSLPPPVKTLPSRAGFPVIVLALAKLFGVGTFMTATVVPIAATAAVALAAGAMVSSSLRRGPWVLAFVAAVVGLSPMLVRLMAPETYTDNILAAALVTAAFVPLLSSASGAQGAAAAIVLLGVAGLAHGPSFLLAVGALTMVAAVYVPSSLRAWRRGHAPVLSTTSARLGLVTAGAVAVTAAGILGLLGTAPDTPKLTWGELRKKFRKDLSLYLLPVTIPLGAIGAGFLAGEARSSRRTTAVAASADDGRFGAGFLLRFLAAWVVAIVAGLAAYGLGYKLAAHRFLAFLVPLPILVAVAILGLGRLARAGGRRWAAIVVVAAGLAGVAVLGGWDLYVTLPNDRGVEWLQPGGVQDASTAAGYLDAAGVPADAPVVFVIDDSGSNPLSYTPEEAYIIRSVLPATRMEHSYFYVGDPERYLAAQPTYRDRPRSYNANERRFWPTIRALLPGKPVALMLGAFNPAYGGFAQEHPDRVVGPHVVVLNGPLLSAPMAVPAAPSGPRTVLGRSVLGAGTLVVLTLIGLGWALALLPVATRSFEAFALAPAFGIAFLLVAGVLVDATGVRLGGVGGTVVAPAAALMGWGMAAARARRAGGLAAARRLFPPR
jgi:hypothetical protein